MTESQVGIDHPRSMLVASMLLGTVANLCIGLAPVSLSALVSAGLLTNSDVGRLSTTEVLFLAAGASIGPGLLRRGRFRTKVAFAAINLTFLNFATFLSTSVVLTYLFRGAAGFFEGILFANLMMLTVSSREPERVNAAFLAFSTVPMVVAIYLFSFWLMPRLGPSSGFGAMAVLALVGSGGAVYLPGASPDGSHHSVHPARHGLPWASIGILLVVFLQNAAIGCVWLYIGRLSVLAGANSRDTGMLTIVFLLAQFVSATAFASRRNTEKRRFAILEVSALLFLITLAFPTWASSSLLLPLAAAYGFFQIILIPLSLRLLMLFDPSGRTGEQVMTMTLLGLASGGFVSSLVVSDQQVTSAYYLGAAFMIAGGLLATACVRVGAADLLKRGF